MFGAAKPKNAFNYEVMLCTEGRWTIEGIFDEETDATQFARDALADPNADEVKIIRYRKTSASDPRETQVYHEKRDRRTDTRILLGEVAPDVPVCRSVDDLFRPESILAISRTLRQYLIKNGITGTELLHSSKYIRQLQGTGNLAASAAHKFAKVQAQAEDIPTKERSAALQALIDGVAAKARALATGANRMPRLGDGGLASMSSRIRADFEADEHDYVLLTILSDELCGVPPYADKLDRILELIKGDLEPQLRAPLEAMAAECLDYSEVVQELFGPHPHLASFLCMLADVLNNKLAKYGEALSPALAIVARLITEGEAPQCRKVLIDRLERELGSNKPMDRRSPEKEADWFDTVLGHLRAADGGVIGGKTTERSIAARKRRIRQQELRDLGLIDAADSL